MRPRHDSATMTASTASSTAASTTAVQWPLDAGRGISLAVAVGVDGGMSLIARLTFRRLTARPFPPAGLGGWLARRPPWLVGLAAALAWIIPIGAVSARSSRGITG